jgi:hypothetical protein
MGRRYKQLSLEERCNNRPDCYWPMGNDHWGTITGERSLGNDHWGTITGNDHCDIINGWIWILAARG